MNEIQQLMIIDDNSIRQHDLKTILEFIGERVVSCGSDTWQSSVEQLSELKGVMIGQLGADIELNQLLTDIISLDCAMSIVLIDYSMGETGAISNQLKKNLVASVNWPLEENELLAAIYACQSCRTSQLTTEQVNRSQSLLRNMVGQSDAMASIRKLIEQVADSDASVLVLGESGTGKEVAARSLHNLSDRANKPFVPINCGAIPAELLESELFGHEKGAFTGALTARKGRFELAEGGTIFLDEIGDMPMPMQVKLLRVLQERTFEKVGSNQSIIADVRIIAATHRDLPSEVKENRFREDLFYRLNVFPIEMPAMRARLDDIPQLVNELVSRLERDKRGSVRLSPNATQSLMKCDWPGNVRELANLMERLCILFPYGVVDVKDLPASYQKENLDSYETPELAEQLRNSIPVSVAGISEIVETKAKIPPKGVNLKEFLKDLEISYIELALSEEGGVVARAAKRLAMQRTTLVEKMRKYGLNKVD